MMDAVPTPVMSTTRDNMAIPFQLPLIAGFMASYEFDVGEFLSQEMRD